MRASLWVSQECANLICSFRRKDVLELARLLLDLRLAIHRQAVGEQALGQSMPANYVSRSLTSLGSEFDNHAAVADRLSASWQGFTKLL